MRSRATGVAASIPERTVLVDGTLNVNIQELRILSLNTTAVGIDASALSLSQGDLYNYEALLGDIQRLAAERSQDIRIETAVTENGGVRGHARLGTTRVGGAD